MKVQETADVFGEELLGLLWAGQYATKVCVSCNGLVGRLIGACSCSPDRIWLQCRCTACQTRDSIAFAKGGNILSLTEFAQHACSQPASMKLFQVIQPGAPHESLPLLDWLRAANEHMGGEALARRQLCVFWSGYDDSHDTPNTWRSATIRRINKETGVCEVKYHDDRRKRSQAFLYLPLAIVHFARCPPAPGADPRVVADGQAPIPPVLPLPQPPMPHHQAKEQTLMLPAPPLSAVCLTAAADASPPPPPQHHQQQQHHHHHHYLGAVSASPSPASPAASADPHFATGTTGSASATTPPLHVRVRSEDWSYNATALPGCAGVKDAERMLGTGASLPPLTAAPTPPCFFLSCNTGTTPPSLVQGDVVVYGGSPRCESSPESPAKRCWSADCGAGQADGSDADGGTADSSTPPYKLQRTAGAFPGQLPTATVLLPSSSVSSSAPLVALGGGGGGGKGDGGVEVAAAVTSRSWTLVSSASWTGAVQAAGSSPTGFGADSFRRSSYLRSSSSSSSSSAAAAALPAFWPPTDGLALLRMLDEASSAQGNKTAATAITTAANKQPPSAPWFDTAFMTLPSAGSDPTQMPERFTAAPGHCNPAASSGICDGARPPCLTTSSTAPYNSATPYPTLPSSSMVSYGAAAPAGIVSLGVAPPTAAAAAAWSTAAAVAATPGATTTAPGQVEQPPPLSGPLELLAPKPSPDSTPDGDVFNAVGGAVSGAGDCPAVVTAASCAGGPVNVGNLTTAVAVQPYIHFDRTSVSSVPRPPSAGGGNPGPFGLDWHGAPSEPAPTAAEAILSNNAAVPQPDPTAAAAAAAAGGAPAATAAPLAPSLASTAFDAELDALLASTFDFFADAAELDDPRCARLLAVQPSGAPGCVSQP